MKRWANRVRVMVAAGVLAAGLGSGLAFGGMIKTKDGRTIEGVTSFLGNGRMMVVPAKGSSVAVEMSNIEEAVCTVKPKATAGKGSADWAMGAIGTAEKVGKFEQFSGGRVLVYDTSRGMLGAKKGFDSLTLVYQQLPEKDGEMTARLLTYQPIRGLQAGLMVRQGLGIDAPYAFLYRGGEPGRTLLTGRMSKGGEMMPGQPSPQPVLGATWLRLTKRGEVVTGYESLDGKKWTKLGEVKLTLTGEAVYMGFAATSPGGGDVYSESLFDKVDVSGAVAVVTAGGEERGVVLRGGSHVAGNVEGFDENVVTLAREDGTTLKVPTKNVARIIVRNVTKGEVEQMGKGSAGVLLVKGDFIDGEVKNLEGGQIKLSSVLFGYQNFQYATEVKGIVLGAVQEKAAGNVEVKLRDGSRLWVKDIKVEKGELVMEEAELGTVKCSVEELVEMKRGK